MCNYKTRNLISVVILCITSSVVGTRFKNDITKSDNKGWLRVCNDDRNQFASSSSSQYEIEAETCPHGAWMSESLPGGCVCINGLWAISQGWCDEDYFVAYGKGHCFQLENPIQKLTFLGNAQDPFESTNFVTKENGHVFRSFSHQFTMPYEFSRDTNRTILRLRPERGTGVLLETVWDNTWKEKGEMEEPRLPINDMMLNEKHICLDTDFKSEWKEGALMIYKVNAGVKRIQVKEECPKTMLSNNALDVGYNDKDVTVFKVLPGQAIHVKSGDVLQSTSNCSSTCSKKHGGSGDSPFSKESPNLIRHKRQALEALELDRDFTEEERDEMLKTANLRVVKQEVNWLLQGIQPPTLETENWRLAQKMKEVFMKVCPENETPYFLINAMMRLFRLFYLTSKDFYPNGHMMEEKAQIDRLINTLDECLNQASELTFSFELVPDHDKCRDVITDNDTVPHTRCQCNEILSSVNIPYSMNMSGTVEDYVVSGAPLNLTDDMIFLVPNENQFDTTVHDFPTETLWKIISFSNFYCAKHFSHTPFDFSSMMTRLEDLFNEDIIYRWTKAGPSTFKVWQYLYHSFNLKKFAKSVDTCVAVAKVVSAYPQWLNRPTMEIKRRRKRSLNSAKLWKGSAYCLDDPWDPVYKLGITVPDKCVDLNRY